jgi:pilus assembly protein CpaB
MNLRALAVAMVVAVMTGVLLVLWVRKVEVETSGGTPVRVLMVTRRVEPGALITEDMLTTRAIPQAWVETRAIRESDKQRIVGLKVETLVQPQQTLLWSDLAITGGGERSLSDLIQPGMRAIGIRPSVEDQSFALVRPGDRVDIVANIPQPKDESSRVSVVLAQNLLVLAVGLDTAGETIGNKNNTERRDSVLTVSATIAQAQQLSLAADRGKLSVALKPRRREDVVDAPELPYGSLLTPKDKVVPAAKPSGPKVLGKDDI